MFRIVENTKIILRRTDMPVEFIATLRRDAIKTALDIYSVIDMDELRKSYLKDNI